MRTGAWSSPPAPLTPPGASTSSGEPACRVTIGDLTWGAEARPLDGAEHAAAVRDLILRYGTPAEGLGDGPSFELRRSEA